MLKRAVVCLAVVLGTRSSLAAFSRPAVHVAFTFPASHPFALNYEDSERLQLEQDAASLLCRILEPTYPFIRFQTTDAAAESRLNVLLADEVLRAGDPSTGAIPIKQAVLRLSIDSEPGDDAESTLLFRDTTEYYLALGPPEQFLAALDIAVRNGLRTQAARLLSNEIGHVALAKIAVKPPRTAYWFMPFALSEVKLGEDTEFTVRAPGGEYLTKPGLPDCKPPAQYTNTAATMTIRPEASIETLRQSGEVDARSVFVSRYSKYRPPPLPLRPP